MSISSAIANWNGKSTDDITAIYDLYYKESDFYSIIVSLLKNKSSETGASWLLKHDFELGGQLNVHEISIVYGSLSQLEHWQAKLHLLQCIAYMPISKKDVKKLESFLRLTLSDSNKFVRAWSYNGFYLLAKQYSEYQEEASQFFDMALRDEAPSVKARVRNILKVGFS